MRSTGRVLKWAAAAALALAMLSRAEGARGAFDIKAVDPRRRGCAGVTAFGWPGVAAGQCPQHEVSFYGLRPFGLDEVTLGAVSCRLSLGPRLRGLEFGWVRLEALAYSEDVYRVAAALGAEDLTIAPAVRLAVTSLDEGRQAGDWAVLVDCHGWVQLSEALWVGAGLENPLGLGLRRSGERVTTAINAWAGMSVSRRIAFGVDLSKADGFPACLATGVEWSVLDGFRLRAGAGTYPRELAFGVGARKGRLALDLATTFNLDLGATHQAGASLAW